MAKEIGEKIPKSLKLLLGFSDDGWAPIPTNLMRAFRENKKEFSLVNLEFLNMEWKGRSSF